MKVAIDTNVLVYAEGLNDGARRIAATDLLNDLSVRGGLFFPVQVMGEFFRVLLRKGGRSKSEAAYLVAFWSDAGQLLPTTPEIFLLAVQLASANNLDIWDAVILAAAITEGCDVLLSEDMHNGFSWSGCTIINPFSAEPHPLLAVVSAYARGTAP
jgi:predicted nucleic acid-binding protein